MVDLLIAWLVNTVSFLVISKIPIGVEIDSFGKAAIAAAVFGIINAVLNPVLSLLSLPLIFLTLGLFIFIINAIIFGIAAALVPGFRLRWGIWSALLGSLFLGVINSMLSGILGSFNL